MRDARTTAPAGATRAAAAGAYWTNDDRAPGPGRLETSLEDHQSLCGSSSKRLPVPALPHVVQREAGTLEVVGYLGHRSELEPWLNVKHPASVEEVIVAVHRDHALGIGRRCCCRFSELAVSTPGGPSATV